MRASAESGVCGILEQLPRKCQGTAADLWTLTLVCAFSSLVQWLLLWPVSQRSLAEARRLADAPGGIGLSDACQEREA